MVGYLITTGIVFVCCIGSSIMLYCDPYNKDDRIWAKRLARLSFLSPLWPIALVCVIIYGVYKYITKILMYKEKE